MLESGSDVTLFNLFTRISHHRRVFVAFITQNMFYQSKNNTTLQGNTCYLVLFKNPRDKTIIRYVARKSHPENPGFLIDAYEDATREPYGYLFIDFLPQTSDELRVRTKIFPSDGEGVGYLPQ